MRHHEDTVYGEFGDASGEKASIIMRMDWTRRGAWESTPPDPTSTSNSIIFTRLSPDPDCRKASAMVRLLHALECHSESCAE